MPITCLDVDEMVQGNSEFSFNDDMEDKKCSLIDMPLEEQSFKSTYKTPEKGAEEDKELIEMAKYGWS